MKGKELMNNNPLYKVPEFPEFDKILPEHAVPAIEALLEEAREKIVALEKDVEPTWESAVKAVGKIAEDVSRTWHIIMHFTSVCNSEEWRNIEESLIPKIIPFFNELMQNKKFYDALIGLRNSQEYNSLSDVQKRILEKKIFSAEESGVGLVGAEKEEFNTIVCDLSKLSTDFSNHVLDATKAFSLMFRDKSDVEGLPNSVLEICAQNARVDGEKDATAENGPWKVSLDYAVLGPFLSNSARRDYREQVYRASVSKASSGEFDNGQILKEILEKRARLVKILGYNTYAELSLKEKMAGESKAVFDMIKQIGDVAMPIAKEEAKELEAFARENGFSEEKFENWDAAFWGRVMTEKKFGFSPEILRPYFQFEKVLSGLFALFTRLTGYVVEAADGMVPVWHKDVRFFKVKNESGEVVAYFYLDPYSRPESKRGGAWMDELNTRELLDNGSMRLPTAFICCNQANPSGGKPSCMTLGEVSTLFHEFGHAIQHMLTTQDISSVSGINGVEWDAVELASQFMENWASRPEVLEEMSSHVETHEKLPREMIDKMREYDNFRAASGVVRQLYFGYTDMLLHDKYPSEQFPTIESCEADAVAKFCTMPPLPEAKFLCSFSHIFAGGYAAGYYSYMWADVLAADAYVAFSEVKSEEELQKLGRRYTKTILGEGGSKHPMDVFVEFRGRKPDPTSLLKVKGIL